jgi:diguanylate cyclase (GGDEF)-like protein/PAS domain S-box-containing protein
MAQPSAVLVGAATETRMRHRLMLRIIALGGLAVVALAFPMVGENRFWLAGLFVTLTPVPALLPRLVPASHWMLSQSIFDVSATVALVGFVPDVWAAGLVIVVCSPAASSALLGRKAYVGLEVFGLIGVGLVGHLSGADGWQVPVAVAALMVPLVASYVDVFLAQELTASARLDDVATSSSAVFWEVEASSGDFVGISGQVEEVLGHSREDLPPDLPSLLAEEDQRCWWERVLDSADDNFVLECRSTTSTGEQVWLRLHVRRVAVGGRHLLRGIAFDITELAKSHEEIRRRAETDHLTGLPNRFMLVKELKTRLAGGHKLALYVFDLDRFKDINDTLGHEAGDDYLRIMARRLDGATDDGFVARMGGDEFAIITPATGLESVVDRANELVALCGAPVMIAGIDFAGSASCGIVIAPLHGTTAEDLLRRGDLAMYAAKRSGSGVHVFEFGTDETNTNRLRLSGEAETALANGQMHLWFQPKVELATGHIIGAEALLRWHHPERGVLLPADFLDIVELTKHRNALRETVVQQGIDFLAHTHAHPNLLSVAINISIRDLFDPNFADLIATQLSRAGIPPTRLILEITERDLMDDRTGFRSAADVITATGVQLSIDDFGTGHSSLLRLHQLPVTELKIDRSFVARLTEDPEAELIAKSIVELGLSLGHTVVAEGIERLNEVHKLRTLGCTIGQGYLYSPAIPRDQFLQLLEGAVNTSPHMPQGSP